MQIVAGISLKGIKPRVWDKNSPYYLPQLRAVMVSYAEFHQRPVLRRKVMKQGLREYLGIPEEVKLYLDNGAFYFISRGGEITTNDYEEFIQGAKPDWCPIPRQDELKHLEKCQCPACKIYGVAGLQENGSVGFWNRATHNLWTLLEEARLIEENLVAGTYKDWYVTHLDIKAFAFSLLNKLFNPF